LDLKNQVETTDAIADIQAAVDAVKDTGKVAIVGYCWGGYLAYLAANKVGGSLRHRLLRRRITDVSQEKRKIPTLLHFSEEDPLIPSRSRPIPASRRMSALSLILARAWLQLCGTQQLQ